MDSFLDNLKKDVQCSLCNGTLTDPKILPCFHIFCKRCINQQTNNELTAEVNVFKCPKCQTLTALPEPNGVEDLKPSAIHSRMLNVVALAEGKKDCKVSESHPPASWYCHDCSRSMCDICVKNHTTFVDSHMVINLNDLKLEDLELILRREDDCTSGHDGQRVEMFCGTCRVLICVYCMKEHEDHDLTSLDTFASAKRAILSKHLEELQLFALDEQKVQEQKNIALWIKQNGENVIQEVKDKTKEVINYLIQNEQELLKQIQSKMYRAINNLNIIHNIPAVKDHINNVIEKGLASDMVNIQETEHCEDYIFSPIKDNSISEIVFVPNNEFLQQLASTGIGEIHTKLKTGCIPNHILEQGDTEPDEMQSSEETDHATSSIQLESEFEALKQGKLLVITKTSAGEPNYDPSDVIDIKISPEENVQIQENYARTDGKIEVVFMAKVAGELTAEVQVNGNHVSNSPLMMNVKPQEMGITREFKMKGESVASPTLTGVAVNKENSKIAVAYESCSCVHIFNTEGDLLLKYGRKGSGERQLLMPEGLAFLNETDLVIADNRNYRLCIVNTTTGALVKTFGKLGKGDGEFNDSYGVHADDEGNIVACDFHNERVQVFTRDGEYRCQFGLTKEDNFHPVSAVTHRERFYVSDYTNNVIHVFEKQDGVLTRVSTIGEKGSGDGQLSEPWGLAIDNNHHLLVCDRGNNRVQKFTLDGRFVGKSRDKLKDPRYVTVLNDGSFLVTTFRSGLFVVNRILGTENATVASPTRRSARTRR